MRTSARSYVSITGIDCIIISTPVTVVALVVTAVVVAVTCSTSLKGFAGTNLVFERTEAS